LKHTYTIEFSKNIILTETEERFLLYKKYEQAIHKENEKDVTLKSYNDSWGNSIFEKNKKITFYQNFKELTPHPEFYPDCYGTYNLIHRIDNKIVAVTVIDILPHMLISDYCYYDPDYSFLDLGVVTVIREIEYMKSFNKLIEDKLTYYSMGEMCQTCQKLKYKGNYKPTEIMDYYTGNYVLLTDEVKTLIGDNKCHVLFSGKNKNNNEENRVKYFSFFEIEQQYFNLMVNIFGEKVYLDTFFSLYLEGQDLLKNKIDSSIKRFLAIIDKELYSKIEFYYEYN
jgi:arginine-tRNA-protein transferase